MAGLGRLKQLVLRGDSISGAGLAQLHLARHLQKLDLGETLTDDDGLRGPTARRASSGSIFTIRWVTDAGLRSLVGLHGLKYLNLAGTQVTGAGLKPLGKISSLVTPQSQSDQGERRRLTRLRALRT